MIEEDRALHLAEGDEGEHGGDAETRQREDCIPTKMAPGILG